MIFQPYRYSIKEDGDEINAIYDFMMHGSEKEPYIILIEIDELNDDKLINTTCTCRDNIFRKRECKHIKMAINTLKDYGVSIN